MELLEKLGLEIGDLISPIIGVLIGYGIIQYMRMSMADFIVWFDLKRKGYRESHEVYINGRYGVITKLGLSTTIFLLEPQNGDRSFRWLHISNSRIPFQVIERISHSKFTISHTHIDRADGGETTTI